VKVANEEITKIQIYLQNMESNKFKLCEEFYICLEKTKNEDIDPFIISENKESYHDNNKKKIYKQSIINKEDLKDSGIMDIERNNSFNDFEST